MFTVVFTLGKDADALEAVAEWGENMVIGVELQCPHCTPDLIVQGKRFYPVSGMETLVAGEKEQRYDEFVFSFGQTISGKTVHVPTKEEFDNLISTTRGGSYGSTINGILFFPNGATITCSDIVASNCNSIISDIWSSPSIITSAQLSILVRGGCLFLPAVGYVDKSGLWYRRGTYGTYWSATYYNSNSAYYLRFSSGSLSTTNYNSQSNYRPVVLVQN